MRQHRKEETALFYTGWSIVFLAGMFYLMYRLLPITYYKFATPCILYSVTGLYCPGCGGTRAIFALLHGQILTSFICHPLVPYTAFVGGLFLISQSIERISRRIVIVNFIVRNFLLVVCHLDILEKFGYQKVFF